MMASDIVVVARHSMARDNGTPEQGARKIPDGNISGFHHKAAIARRSKQLSLNIVHSST
jgi:hypothetical protein